MKPAPQRLLIAFVMAQFGKSLLWVGEDALALYILIVALHVSPGLAGAIFLVSSFWNAVMDIAWGSMLSRHPALERRLPLIAAIAMLLGCGGFALLPFTSGSIVASTGVLILFRTAFPLFDVPHNATMTVLAGDLGHLAVARWRALGGAVAAVLIGATTMPLLLAGGQAGGPARLLMPLIAAVALVLLLPLPWLLAHVGHVRPATGDYRPIAPKILSFCLIQMVGFAAFASIGKAMLHLQAAVSLAGAGPLLMTAMRLAGVWLWFPVARRLGTSHALSLAYGAALIVVLLIPPVIELGTGATAGIFALFGVALGGVALLTWSRFSEAARECDTPGGVARDYGLFTATTKIGLGISGALTGTWLDSFPEGSHLPAFSAWPLVLVVALLALSVTFLNWIADRHGKGAPTQF